MKLIHYNGHFFDAETQKRVILAPFMSVNIDDAYVLPCQKPQTVILPAEAQRDELMRDERNAEYQMVLPRGTRVAFEFLMCDADEQWKGLKGLKERHPENYDNARIQRHSIEVECVLLEDLYAVSTIGKKGEVGCKFLRCACETVECHPSIPFFETISGDTLAQLYRRVTDYLIPENGVYNANVGDTFYITEQSIRRQEPIHPAEEKYWHLKNFVNRVYDHSKRIHFL